MYTAAEIERAIPERIDRLPLSREIWRIMLLAGIAWLIESYDIGIIGTVLPTLEKQFQLNTAAIAIVSTISTLGIVVAVVPSGWLADRLGRKKVLIVGTAWYALFSLLTAFSPNILVLIILRFIAGLGMGAVFPIPYTMSAELLSRNLRGTMTSVLDSCLSFGYFLSPFLALVVIPHLSVNMGWRLLFVIGGLPLLYVPVIMKWMPESPRWLQTKGRIQEADQIVSDLEHVIERRAGTALPALQLEMNTYQLKSLSPMLIFRRAYIKRTVMMWISFACILFIFYAIQTYTPTVLLKQGYGMSNAFLLTTIIVLASIPGKYFAAYTLERFGRKFTLIAFTLVAAMGAILFGFAHNAGLALCCGCIMSFFGIGVDPAIKIYGAEQYPTSIRETGISFFECIGRLFGGVLAPFIMAFLLTQVNIAGSYIFVAAISLFGVLAVALLGTETKGKLLEKTVEPSPAVNYTER